jgi:hypothetical protein
MPSRIVGVNEWPALVSFRGEGPSSARKLVGVDKTIVRGPLEARPPLYFLDARNQVGRGTRLADFHASPSLGRSLRA